MRFKHGDRVIVRTAVGARPGVVTFVYTVMRRYEVNLDRSHIRNSYSENVVGAEAILDRLAEI